MKKTIFASIILIVMILLSCESFAAIKSTASLSQNATSVEKGKYVTCTYSINLTEGTVNGFEGYLTYDKDFFTDVTVSGNYPINNGNGYSKDGNGLIGIETSGEIKSGALFTVKLKIDENTTKESGQVKVSSASVFNISQDTCDLANVAVTVSVKEAEQPETPSDDNKDENKEEDKKEENKNEQQPPSGNIDNNQQQQNQNKEEDNAKPNNNQGSSNKKDNQANVIIPHAGIGNKYTGILMVMLILSIISLIKCTKKKIK